MTVSLDGACPFQAGADKCGLPVVAYDQERTIAVCPEGHQSSSAHLTGAGGRKVTPVKFRHRRFEPKDAALATVIAALVLNAIVEHL